MQTKLSSDLESIIEQLKVINAAYSQLLTEVQTWKQRAETAEELLGLVDTVSSLRKIRETAENRGLPVREWVTETLVEACEPRTELPIDPLVYQNLQSIASGRGISMSELGRGVDFTEMLTECLENRRI